MARQKTDQTPAPVQAKPAASPNTTLTLQTFSKEEKTGSKKKN
jgi:hypothetical protein